MRVHGTSTIVSRARVSGRTHAFQRLLQQAMDRTTGLLTIHRLVQRFLILIRARRRYVSSATGPATSTGAPGTSAPGTSSPPKPKPKRLHGGYNPAIHGNYDPNAPYAQEAEEEEEEEATAAAASLTNPQGNGYATTAHFNRWTGRFQQPGINPEYHNDENKSKRQMNAFFDVDAAANSHDGRSLRAERRGKTLTKKELKAYKEKRHHKKEEKRKAWLRD
jgi:hypothetical protein